MDGYCARITLALSAAAACGAAAGAGAAVWRAPAVAQAQMSASSSENTGRILGPSRLHYSTSSTTNGCPTNTHTTTHTMQAPLARGIGRRPHSGDPITGPECTSSKENIPSKVSPFTTRRGAVRVA